MYYMLFMTSAWILEALVKLINVFWVLLEYIMWNARIREVSFAFLFKIARNTKVIEINTFSSGFSWPQRHSYLTSHSLHSTYVFQDISLFGA